MPNIYLLTQDIIEGYGTYDSAIVIANSMDEARKIHPSYGMAFSKWDGSDWPSSDQLGSINVTYLGATDLEPRLVLASFRGG